MTSIITDRRGFTIIETTIVLAIAGLIFLVMLEAIPAVTRGGRNNQRKQDVAAVLGAVSHYELNNSAKFPESCGGVSNPCTGADGSVAPDFFLKSDVSKIRLSYFDPEAIFLTGFGSALDARPGTFSSDTDIEKVYIFNYAKCDASTFGKPTAVGAGYNDVVALYALEAGSGPAPQCQQL